MNLPSLNKTALAIATTLVFMAGCSDKPTNTTTAGSNETKPPKT